MDFKSAYNYLGNTKNACIVKEGHRYSLSTDYSPSSTSITSTLFWAFYKKDLVVKTATVDGRDIYRPKLLKFSTVNP